MPKIKDDLQIPKKEIVYSDEDLKSFHDILSKKYRIYGLNIKKELCSFVSERLYLEKEKDALRDGGIVVSNFITIHNDRELTHSCDPILYEMALDMIKQYKNWQYRCGAYTESLRIECSEEFKKKHPDWQEILKSGPLWDSEKGGLIKVSLTSL